MLLWKDVLFVGCIIVDLQCVIPSFLRRVIGGIDAEIKQFPYQISLRNKIDGNGNICGGSIISSSWVLSAAHCVHDGTIDRFNVTLVIVVGTNSLLEGGIFYDVAYYKFHENHITGGYTSDIAVIRTSTAMRFNPSVQPISLANTNVPDGSDVILTGFGLVNYLEQESPTILQHIHLSIMPFDECYDIWKDLLENDDICTYTEINHGACRGDSGGPLVDILSGVQIGVVSWGSPCANGFPDVYTSVASHRQWIYDKTGI